MASPAPGGPPAPPVGRAVPPASPPLSPPLTPPRPSLPSLSTRRWRLGLLLLSALAAIAAAVLRALLFDDLSVNNDEVTYLLQAGALRDGHLTLPAGSGDHPWLFARVGSEYVGKYAPFWPALLAVTGPVLAPPLVAAALPPAVALLARETGAGRRASLLSAALVALSPLLLVQSATVLTYAPALVLWTAGAGLLLRAARTRRAVPSAGAGLVLAELAATRPYDALLLSLPLAVAALRRGLPLRGVLAAAAGAAPVVALQLAYNAAVTGSPLRLPFNLAEPADTLGFGVRRLIPEAADRRFGAFEAVDGLRRMLGDLLAWGTVVPLLLVVVVLAVRAGSRGPRPLLWSAALLCAGYAVFWGPWNVHVLWGATRWLGPVYAVPLLAALAVAAGPGLLGLARSRPRLVAAAALPLIALNAFVLVRAVAGHARFAGQSDQVLALAASVPGPLLVDSGVPYLGNPVTALALDESRVRPSPRVRALTAGPADLALGTVWRLDLTDAYDPVIDEAGTVLGQVRPQAGGRLAVSEVRGRRIRALLLSAGGATPLRCPAPHVVTLGPRVDCAGGIPARDRRLQTAARRCDCLVLQARVRGASRVQRKLPLVPVAGTWSTLVDVGPLRVTGYVRQLQVRALS